jgi:hypothetical protein
MRPNPKVEAKVDELMADPWYKIGGVDGGVEIDACVPPHPADPAPPPIESSVAVMETSIQLQSNFNPTSIQLQSNFSPTPSRRLRA